MSLSKISFLPIPSPTYMQDYYFNLCGCLFRVYSGVTYDAKHYNGCKKGAEGRPAHAVYELFFLLSFFNQKNPHNMCSGDPNFNDQHKALGFGGFLLLCGSVL